MRGWQVKRIKLFINTLIYWLDPQRGVIASLKQKVAAQDDLILTVRANRQSILNENAKLMAELARIQSEKKEVVGG